MDSADGPKIYLAWKLTMSPTELKREWKAIGNELQPFPMAALEGVHLPSGVVQFLHEVGLPKDAAPFLTFRAPPKGRLRTADELFGVGTASEECYEIGSNGCGDTIVLRPDGSVAYLNHDRSFAPVYMAKSLPALAEALLCFSQIIAEARGRAIPDANSDELYDRELRTKFESYLRAVDSQALVGESMWAKEIVMWFSAD